MKEEHEELMGFLRRASGIKDATGKPIRDLLEVLEPHFEKEEMHAMPLLGTLEELASKKEIPYLKEMADSRDALSLEYKSMFKEHAQIGKLIKDARKAALSENHNDVVDMLDALAHHARVEEEVLYPAALIAGSLAKNLLSKHQ